MGDKLRLWVGTAAAVVALLVLVGAAGPLNNPVDLNSVAQDICADNANGPCLQNEAASSTNPTVIPNKTDPDTGIGSAGADQLSLIAGGVEAVRATSGNVTMASNACFLAHNSVTDVDQTGNGAQATVDFDTEIFDQGGDFAADAFTAPVTGRYLLTATVQILSMTTAADGATLRIVTSNRTYRGNRFDLGGDFPPVLGLTMSAVADMDAADTATVTVAVTGEASDLIVDIEGSASSELFTSFSGCLVS